MLNWILAPRSGSRCPFQKPPGMTQLIDASLISILPARFTNFRGNPSWEKRKNVLYLHDAVPERHFFSASLSRGHLVICPRLLCFPRENLRNHMNKTSFKRREIVRNKQRLIFSWYKFYSRFTHSKQRYRNIITRAVNRLKNN